MSSDSEDDPDYVPTVSQNDGLHACSYIVLPIANEHIHRRLEFI